MRAVAGLYHAYFTGLILTLVTRREPADAAEWVFRPFRHQHHEKFLSSFEKLGLEGHARRGRLRRLPLSLQQHRRGDGRVHARVGTARPGVNFVPPRWIYPGASICGVPSEVSRAFLRAWYAHNGVSLNNPRLGFARGPLKRPPKMARRIRSLPPPGARGAAHIPVPASWRRRSIPLAAPKLPDADWPAERLAKAQRNYAMEYIRSGLPRLVELLGPAEGSAPRPCRRVISSAPSSTRRRRRCWASRPAARRLSASSSRGLAAGEGDEAEDDDRKVTR